VSDRDLSTGIRQVFGDVKKGNNCRICGRDVADGRMKYCSEYCSNLASAVMGLLNWGGVRRRIIDRDDETCQHCGYDHTRERRARDHIRARIHEQLPDRPRGPNLLEIGPGEIEQSDVVEHNEAMASWQQQRNELEERYGNPHEYARRLEVDHIQPITDGGHPFDPGNLQTLCSDCHTEKTSTEASERAETPTRNELNQSLFEYVATDGGAER
jgi:5-methylcytosine-specific restriction endonuclease McrA